MLCLLCCYSVFFVRGRGRLGMATVTPATPVTREWYVRLENLDSGRAPLRIDHDSRKGYQRIVTEWEGDDGEEELGVGEGEALCAAILAHYGLGREMRDRMRVFSSPFRMRRLDRLVAIPLDEVFVSVYFL